MKNNKAFTLAEILITLTIIGVVAAITIPSIVTNINDKAWRTQKKALHVRLTNAISDMPKLKGFGEYKEVKNSETNETEITDTAGETFLVEGLSKIYKMTNICGKNNLDKCGISKKIKKYNGAEINFPKTLKELAVGGTLVFSNINAVAFETTNNEAVAVFYNPTCSGKHFPYVGGESFGENICFHFIYDLNKDKMPNQLGKDMGIISAIYDKNENLTFVSPTIYEKGIIGSAPYYAEDGNDALSLCKKENKDLRLPTIEEAGAMAMSLYFYTDYFNNGKSFATSSVVSSGEDGSIWRTQVHFTGNHTAYAVSTPKSTSLNVLCVYDN